MQAILNALSQRRASTFVIWAVAGCIAAVSCCLNMSSAHIGTEYFPMGNDSFYHARRILDAVPDLSSFYQFDPKIHAPEGSLLVWPWGYDYLMAGLVRLAIDTGLSVDPLRALLWIPVVAVFISIALLILIARRLGLSTWPTALAALCMALAPSTQLLHGFGEIDHHFAEQMFLLGSLWAGLAWFQERNVPWGIALGSMLGLSLGVHNALFILQLPLLATLFIGWLQGNYPPRRALIALVVALLCSTLAVLIPSEPFMAGRFEFYTLSWFHLYIVCGTAAVVLLLSWLQPTRKSLAALVVLGIVLLAPLLHEIRIAQSFLQGSTSILGDIAEVRSPLQRVLAGKAKWVTFFYSLLIWIAPVTFMLSVVQCWRERRSPHLLLWITAVFGLALLAMQIRMHYFGAFALYVPWLVLAQRYASAHVDFAKRTYLLTTLGLLLAYVPQIRHTLIAPVPPAADMWFGNFHELVQPMQQACAEDPGVMLADSNAGHYIRFYTDCSVIANNFLLTEQQFRKIDETARLFSLPAGELRSEAPYVKYVLIRAASVARQHDGTYSFAFFAVKSAQLSHDLLFNAETQVPPGYKLIAEAHINVRQGQRVQQLPYARLYKLEPAVTPATATTSANDIAQ